MKYFYSCDWGTSTFRLRLVDAENVTVLSEIKTAHGIATTFESWTQTNQHEKNRIAFYQAYLFEQVKKITTAFDDPLHDAPIILSGMASSSIGMLQLPYKELPFRCDGTELVLHIMRTEGRHRHKIVIISGARSAVDVIRGEETLLAGCDVPVNDTEQLFIFPGTHSKHMIVKSGLVISIATFMTGELFDLLSNKSVLSASVEKNALELSGTDQHFIEGVKEGTVSNLMNSIFHVRTNQLFNKATPLENYHYLSGLLIGHELKDVAENEPYSITLVCGEGLKKAYMLAFGVLGLSNRVNIKNADDALIKGQWKIMKRPVPFII